jgi:mannose-6-phosphate isomerase
MSDESVRPWGHYEVLQESTTHKVKCIWVKPGARLSYQKHQKRSEHWYIVSGIADVTLDGVNSIKNPGETVDVALDQLHRIGNSGTEELIFIEVQTGTYFGEDDIERVSDDYSR